MGKAVRVATRRSPLALAQAGQLAARLRELTGRDVVMVPVASAGDLTEGSLVDLGGTGLFTTAVRDAVKSGQADIAVHSLKDLPTAADSRLFLAAVPEREDCRDALITGSNCAGLAELPSGAKVGTGSPRRAAQLRRLRPDLRIVDIRGNIDTRIARTASGELAAVILAVAGLRRLNQADWAFLPLPVPIPITQMLPAPGQGALAVEAAADLDQRDSELTAALATIDHPLSRAAVSAERSLLAGLEAGCAAPVGAVAQLVMGNLNQIHLAAAAISVDGRQEVRLSITGASGQASQLGRQLAAKMLAAGAAALIGAPAK